MSLVSRLFPEPDQREASFLGDLFRKETVGGVLALAAALLGVVWANSPWSDGYTDLRHLAVGPLDVEHWAADGALALFFFVAGLELKRELVIGSLRRPADAAVPVAAAVCGVAVPALLYLAVNSGGSGEPGGWAIPAATDIAFALAVLAVVGSNLPTALRAFLLTLAVVDDLIVIVIIAVFFTDQLHLLALLVAVAAMVVWAWLQTRRVATPWVYVPLGVVCWWAVHESGIHATIAGVALGLLTRVRHDPGEEHSPAEHAEHLLAPISSSVAVPFFALMSTGVALSGGAGLVRSPIVIGVVVGLVVGKPLGVFTGAWVVARFTHAELDESLSWRDVVGMAVLAGIGFTVSLLVSDLSFGGADREAAKTAVLVGSLTSGLLGALVLGHRDRLRITP
ncbi:Na+/H+ antiporter NhaA [Nocardioides islandensis]|uniref:Na(+)/H(+) antiporter NhaA n=1 Tax=Nocardioides islandensis TaxID=433663 RepID=A0A930VD18_9ACTN|nr:Na+/H+ antiporter NhaA [Nocardioides islandensis]MBF4762367.1 Na+/H+ antiporter NhaA [Nocardioides islandensis]